MIPAKLIAKDTAISPTPVHKDKAPTMISLRDIFLFEESCALFQHFSSVQHVVWRCNCVTLATLGSNERMLLCTLTTLHTGPPPYLSTTASIVQHCAAQLVCYGILLERQPRHIQWVWPAQLLVTFTGSLTLVQSRCQIQHHDVEFIIIFLPASSFISDCFLQPSNLLCSFRNFLMCYFHYIIIIIGR